LCRWTLSLKTRACSQDLRKELDKEREELAAEVAKNEALQQQAEELVSEKLKLQAEAEALREETKALHNRAETLAESADSLLKEKNCMQCKVFSLTSKF